MSEQISIRLALTGQQDVARGLKQTGDAGDRELGRISVAAEGVTRAVGEIASVLGIAFAGEQFVEANRDAGRLRASLEVLTGSAETAGAVWRTLSAEFGSQIGTDAAVEAFAKLKALGLAPTIEAIRAYSNVAAAMGKPLEQFVEAVADATTGEFERLKEFGIKAKADGDKVALTFQGQTQTIANNARAIEQYLQAIGNNQFAGAVEKQAQTLGGALTRAKDQANQFFVAIGDAGASDTLARGINSASDAIAGLTNSIGSGDLFAPLISGAQSWVDEISRGAESAGISIEGVKYAAEETARVISESTREWVDDAINIISDLPTYLRNGIAIWIADIDGFVIDVSAGWERIKVTADAAWSGVTDIVRESVTSMRKYLSSLAEDAARAVAGALGVQGADFGFGGGVDGGAAASRSAEAAARLKQIEDQRKASHAASEEAVRGMLDEQQATINARKERDALAAQDRRRAAQLRQIGDRERFARATIASPASGAAPGGKSGGGGKSDAEKATDAYQRQIDRLREAIAIEQERMRVGSDATEAAKLRYQTEEGALKSLSVEQKKQLVTYAEQLDAIKAQEKSAKDLADVQADLAKESAAAQERQIESITRIVEDGAGRMADAFIEFAFTGKKSFGDLASSVVRDFARIYFQAQIVKPLVDSITGGGSIGGIIAKTLGIGGWQYGGEDLALGIPDEMSFNANGNAFDGSGIIPFARGGVVANPTLFRFAKGTGLMGEAGPEAIMPLARDGSGRLGVRSAAASPSVTVNVVNQSSQPVDVQRSAPRVDGDRLVVDVLLRDLQRNGPAAQAMAGAFNLRRGA